MNMRFIRYHKSGSALVMTLLVIALLSTIVVAFLTSMNLERTVAKSHRNRLQAELAAQTAFATATDKIKRTLLANPWHGVGMKEVNGQLSPVIVGGGTPSAPPTTETLLFSIQDETAASTAIEFNASNSIDMNIRRNAADAGGWIGSPAGAPRPACRAQWIEILQDPSKEEQPNRRLPEYNPVVARFAYWVEDEAAKLDLTLAGNADGSPQGQFERSEHGSEVTDLDLGALPLKDSSPLDYQQNLARSLNASLIAQQDHPYKSADAKLVNLLDPSGGEDTAEKIQFYATRFSKSLDTAMSGRRRANLNAIVTPAVNSPDSIAADINDIAWVITGRHVMTSSHTLDNEASAGLFLDQPQEEGPLPTFGDRFFRDSAAGFGRELVREIYLRKLAANIRDYIDGDHQPTLITASGAVPSSIPPETTPSAQQANYQAIGKEVSPYLQEHAWRGFIESWSQTGNTVTATLRFDHYFELTNPTTSDFVAGTGTYLKVYNQPRWSAGSFPMLIPGDFEVDLTGIRIPAGDVVVVTTNTTGQHPPNLVHDSTKLIPRAANPASALRIENAQSDRQISSARGFRLQGRSTSSTDYRTEFLLARREVVAGADQGLISYFPSMSVSLFRYPWNITARGSNVGSQTRFVYSSSLRGNDRPSRSGDPRSLTEQLRFMDYRSGGNGDQTRFYGSIQGHSDTGSPRIPGNSSLTRNHIRFVTPANWPDYHLRSNDSADTAQGVIANRSMRSIGELGHIYDPHRKITTESRRDIRHARGGGRSLRIGQPDDIVPSGRFATSGATTEWFNAAWRLCDLFAAEDPSIAVAPSTSRGKININGSIRDNGTVLRAALRHFEFLDSPAGDKNRNGQELLDEEIDSFVNDVIAYLESNGPFLERGEVSRLDFFSASERRTGGTRNHLLIDRGREEIFRRIVELITTRSASYAIYTIGEAVDQRPNGELIPKARFGRKTIVELTPTATDPSGGGEEVPLDDLADSPAAKLAGFDLQSVYESNLH